MGMGMHTTPTVAADGGGGGSRPTSRAGGLTGGPGTTTTTNTNTTASRPGTGTGSAAAMARAQLLQARTVARLVERATSGGAASSLQAVSSFSDAATAMSVAPVFLPPLSPGLYLPPTR